MNYQEHKLKLIKNPEFRRAWKSLRWWYLYQRFLVWVRKICDTWRREDD